jgi:putative protease
MPTADDFSFSEHGENTEMKELVGIVLGYWPKIGVANVKVVNKKLKIGDEIYLSNKDSSIQRVKIESMQINHQNVEFAEKGQEVGIKLPTCKKNDDVYLILRKENKL